MLDRKLGKKIEWLYVLGGINFMSALIRDRFFPIEERVGGQIFVTWKHLCRKN